MPPKSCILCAHEPRLFFENKWRYYQCTHCHLVFLDPSQRMSTQEEFARYQKHENQVSDRGYAEFLQRTLAPLLPCLKKGMFGLDYGSGATRACAELLRPKGFVLESYDLFFYPQASLLEKSYDFLLCSETAEHFREPFLEFQRLHALLRPGARLLVRTEWLEKDFAAWHYHRDRSHICFYSPETFAFLAKCFAWEVEYCAESIFIFKKS